MEGNRMTFVSWTFVWLTSLLGGLGIAGLCLIPRVWDWLEDVFQPVPGLGGIWGGVISISLIYAAAMLFIFDLSFGQIVVWLLCLFVATPSSVVVEYYVWHTVDQMREQKQSNGTI